MKNKRYMSLNNEQHSTGGGTYDGKQGLNGSTILSVMIP